MHRLLAALALAGAVLAHAQTPAPPLTICADPYPAALAIDGARLQVDGVAVPGATCSVKPLAGGGLVPTCQVPRTALGEGRRIIGMAACKGSNCSAYTPRAYQVTLSGCTKADAATSRLSCSWQLVPDPPAAVGPAPCGELPAAAVWQALGGSVYAVQADGALRLASPARRVPAGTACNCASPRVVGGVSYCPFAGAGASEITACRVAP